MKALSLLLLRLSTGIYLVLWGVYKFINLDRAVNLSETFYGGVTSAEAVNYAIGGFEIIVGVLVILGLVRSISYLAQLLIYTVGIMPIIVYILDPLALYLLESGKLTWFPSTTLMFASLVIIVFKSEDSLSLDHKRGK